MVVVFYLCFVSRDDVESKQEGKWWDGASVEYARSPLSPWGRKDVVPPSPFPGSFTLKRTLSDSTIFEPRTIADL